MKKEFCSTSLIPSKTISKKIWRFYFEFYFSQLGCTSDLGELYQSHHVGAAFGLLNKKYPIFCGGQQKLAASRALDTCVIFNHPTKTYLDMDTERDMPGGVLVDSDTFWVAGGRLENETALKSTILVTEKGWEQGPDLPLPLYDICMLKINASTYAVISRFPEKKVYFYNWDAKNWYLEMETCHPFYVDFGCAYDPKLRRIYFGGGHRGEAKTGSNLNILELDSLLMTCSTSFPLSFESGSTTLIFYDRYLYYFNIIKTYPYKKCFDCATETDWTAVENAEMNTRVKFFYMFLPDDLATCN